jgi:hypothetical protein
MADEFGPSMITVFLRVHGSPACRRFAAPAEDDGKVYAAAGLGSQRAARPKTFAVL